MIPKIYKEQAILKLSGIRNRVFIILILLLLSGCLGERSTYRQALHDARHPDPDEVSDSLLALTPANPKADVRLINGMPYAALVTWALDSSIVYRDSTGRWRAAEDIWVTAEPELREKCRLMMKRNPKSPDRQLQYLLGLPPTYHGRVLIRFRAPIDSIFRPCPDPEVTDTRCELTYPVNVPERHRKWMKETLEASYSSSKLYERFPWTRLGYTYNWAPDAKSEFGLSEFVVRKGTPLTEVGFVKKEIYCKNSGLK